MQNRKLEFVISSDVRLHAKIIWRIIIIETEIRQSFLEIKDCRQHGGK